MPRHIPDSWLFNRREPEEESEEDKIIKLYCFIKGYQIESKKKNFDLYKFVENYIKNEK
jgi:hypothetical protein